MLQNYDVWGASATPGPNAPLADGCKTSSQPGANATAAVKAWSAAGFPKNKIMLGLPLYGYVSKSTKTVLVDVVVPKAETARMVGPAGQEASATKIPGTTDVAGETVPSPLPAIDGAHDADASVAVASEELKPLHDTSNANFLDGAHDRTSQKAAALGTAPVQVPDPVDVKPKPKKRWSLPVGGTKAKPAEEVKKVPDEVAASEDAGKGRATEAVPDASSSGTGEGAHATEVSGRLAAAPMAQAVAGDLSSSFGQQIAFSDILAKGALVRSGTGYAAANGYTRGTIGSLVQYLNQF
jgi:hypothetical protein